MVRLDEQERADKRRADDLEENKRTDKRVDGFANKALSMSESTNASQRLQMRIMAAVIVLLVCAFLVLAGHSIGIDIPGIGQFTGGGGTLEAPIEDGDE
jgi:hypothetical protein